MRVGDTEVSDTKTWKNDDEKTRPESITVQLFADNEATDKDDGKPGKGLPSTASDMYNLIVIGLLMIIVGAGLFIVKRKRTNE